MAHEWPEIRDKIDKMYHAIFESNGEPSIKEHLRDHSRRIGAIEDGEKEKRVGVKGVILAVAGQIIAGLLIWLAATAWASHGATNASAQTPAPPASTARP